MLVVEIVQMILNILLASYKDRTSIIYLIVTIQR